MDSIKTREGLYQVLKTLGMMTVTHRSPRSPSCPFWVASAMPSHFSLKKIQAPRCSRMSPRNSPTCWLEMGEDMKEELEEEMKEEMEEEMG